MERTSEQKSTQDSESTQERREALAVLDPRDPIDAEIIKYKTKIHKEETPTQFEQKELIKTIQFSDDDSAADKLVAINRGFIAAIAYQFKSEAYDNTDELFEAGATALLDAAAHYNLANSKVSFTNYVAAHIQNTLKAVAPQVEAPYLINDEPQPLLTIYKFLSMLKTMKRSELDEHTKVAILTNADIVSLLPLTDKELFEVRGLDSSTFYSRLHSLYETLGIPNRTSLALASKKAGIEFNTPKVPKGTHFTPTERKIAPYLHLEFAEVAKMLGYSEESVERVSTGLRAKLGAQSRTELVLMLDTADLREPAPKPKEVEEFTAYELKVLPFIQHETSVIMQLTGLTNSGVQTALNKAFKRTGTNSRQALALNLLERGFPIAIAPPKDSLNALFHEKQMDVLKNLHLERPEVARLGDMTENAVASFIYEAQQKTGARTQIELLLMAHIYDTGERRAKDERTKHERLADKLGWGTLNAERLNGLLEMLNPKQQTLIKSYYLSDEEITWSTIAKGLGIDTHVAISTAHYGLLRMKNRFDTDSAA
jgi:DNA-directed RNA polymerase specialized sigma subunit/DNA-binding CsgD family transcriptional regulator